MRILFCWRQYHQSVGGVERMSIELMNQMNKRGHEISLISWDHAGAQPYYSLNTNTNWMKLDLGDFTVKANMAIRLKRMMKIRNFVKKTKPDVIIAFMDGIFLTTRLSIFGMKVPVIEAERVSPARFKFIGTPAREFFVYHSLLCRYSCGMRI
jgi:predicted glycosyltransferase